MRRLTALCLWALWPAPAAFANAPSAELELCLLHLREGERALLQKAQGPLGALPLYRLELEVDPDEGVARGRAQVRYTARTGPLRALHLRLSANAQAPRVKLSSATLGGKAVVLEQPEPTLYRIRLDPPLARGAVANVEVRLEATFPRGRPGGQGAMVLSGILPMVPPADAKGEPWPGPTGAQDAVVHEPSLVLAMITLPRGYQAIATGMAQGEVPARDGRVRHSFAAAGVRAYPLVVAKDYQRAGITVNGVELESWHQDAQVAEQTLAHAAAAVVELEKRLGPLPHRVLRLVQPPKAAFAPDPLGALGALGDLGALGLPPALEAMLGGTGSGELAVAQEVARGYFPGLVGSDQVTHPVVGEALARYLALLSIEGRHGAQAAARVRQDHLVTAYQLYRLGGGEDGPAARPTSSFSGRGEYAALVQSKAPLLFGQVRKEMGDEAFFKSLRAHLDEYRWGFACPECFTRTAARLRPQKAKALEALRRRWWEQAHGDEDLGTAEVASLLRSLTGVELDPQTEALLRQWVPQLLGPFGP